MTTGEWNAERIAADLDQSIRRGDYPEGSRLPGRRALVDRYGVATATVERALHALRGDGLIYPVTGSGWFVRSPRPVLRSARARLSRVERADGRGAFSTDGHTGGWEVRADTEVSREPVPADVAGYLGLDAGSEVVIRDRVMFADDEPVQLATSYLPADLLDVAPAIGETDTGPGGIYARLDESVWRLARFTETVRIGSTTEHESRLLRMSAGAPVLRIVRVAHAERDDRAVEVNLITAAGDRWELHYDIPAD